MAASSEEHVSLRTWIAVLGTILGATMAPAIGPYIGGLITDNYGWPMVFYVNLIPGAVMLATIFSRSIQNR